MKCLQPTSLIDTPVVQAPTGVTIIVAYMMFSYIKMYVPFDPLIRWIRMSVCRVWKIFEYTAQLISTQAP